MARKLSGTFKLNKNESIHRWFPYMEGYSGSLVEYEIEKIGLENIENLYDPFGGSGTTLLVAAKLGIKPYYSEINPLMSFICGVKINDVIKVSNKPEILNELNELYSMVDSHIFNYEQEIEFIGFEKYFEMKKLCELQDIIKIIQQMKLKESRNFGMVAIAGITTQISKMIRRGDLRYAKGNEKNNVNQNVREVFLMKLEEIISDIKNERYKIQKEVVKAADDARNINFENEIDCVITSPPYLNGTNYIRNTKLELRLLDFIKDESQLPELHSKGIIAGINSVSKRNGNIPVLNEVKPYYEKLLPVAYDKRIPLMVAGYFYDMNNVFEKLSRAMKNNGIFIMDIGDSQFAGVHIPTHELLGKIALKHGFTKYEEEILRTRRSNNGMTLSQVVMRFRLNKPGE